MMTMMNGDYLKKYRADLELKRSDHNDDVLAEAEYGHLRNVTFLDHAANGIYMKSLIKAYQDALLTTSTDNNASCCLFSNPHSQSQSGLYTSSIIEQTRKRILSCLFNTNSSEYDVVFCQNATHGLKMLAESFSFVDEAESEEEAVATDMQANFCYFNDNHTSVIGMRELVANCNVYCMFENDDDENRFKMSSKLVSSKIKSNSSAKTARSLFVYPAQSNFNGRKYPLEIIDQIQNGNIKDILSLPSQSSNCDWFVCLDTASFITSSPLDLSRTAPNRPDFLVVSFYKFFGFPTGIGALLIRKNKRTERCLKKKYFGGGTVSLALVDEDTFYFRKSTHSIIPSFHEWFEDGTVSYLQILAVSLMIEKLDQITYKRGLIVLNNHLSILTDYCLSRMLNLKHSNGTDLVELYRRKIRATKNDHYGPIIAFNLRNSRGKFISFNLVNKLAQESGIHLRTGCFCNIGACVMFLKHLKEEKTLLNNFLLHGHKCGDSIDLIDGKPTGAIRVSFGHCSALKDVDKLIFFLNENFVAYGRQNQQDEAISTRIRNRKMKTEEFYKINRLFIYPIKSCAPMEILEDEWEIEMLTMGSNISSSSSSLMYDRSWTIIDSNQVQLNQKRLPNLAKLEPSVYREKLILKLKYESESFELNLEKRPEIESNEHRSIYPINSYGAGDELFGIDEGAEVAAWLTRILNQSCKLIRIVQQKYDADLQKTQMAFKNKADYLLINQRSVAKLRNHLIRLQKLDESSTSLLNDAEKLKIIDDYLYKQFRPNIVVDSVDSTMADEISENDGDENGFEEELWKEIRLLNSSITFQLVDNCSRCQMINISQMQQQQQETDEVELDLKNFSDGLLKNLFQLKSNSKFGIYLRLKMARDHQTIKLGRHSIGRVHYDAEKIDLINH